MTSDPDVLEPLESHWLALCLCTESNRRKEWPLIAQVIQNRVRSKRYPDDFVGVILQPMQFSAFNSFTARKGKAAFSRAEIFYLVFRGHASLLLLAHAIDHAALMIEADANGQRISDLITPATLHYFSPVSMPGGKEPSWAMTASRIYCPAGFDPNRFRFCEGVQ